MSDVVERARAADVIAEVPHLLSTYVADAGDGCPGVFMNSQREVAEKAVAALEAAGYANVKLREPDSKTANTAAWHFHYGGHSGFHSCVGQVSRNVGIVLLNGVPYDSDQARDLAAALLAAAREADNA